MGQEEVLKILKKAKKPLTSKEIAELIDIGSRSVRRILKALTEDVTTNLVAKKLTPKEMIEHYGRIINSNNLKIYFLDGVVSLKNS